MKLLWRDVNEETSNTVAFQFRVWRRSIYALGEWRIKFETTHQSINQYVANTYVLNPAAGYWSLLDVLVYTLSTPSPPQEQLIPLLDEAEEKAVKRAIMLLDRM